MVPQYHTFIFLLSKMCLILLANYHLLIVPVFVAPCLSHSQTPSLAKGFQLCNTSQRTNCFFFFLLSVMFLLSTLWFFFYFPCIYCADYFSHKLSNQMHFFLLWYLISFYVFPSKSRFGYSLYILIVMFLILFNIS